MAPAIALISPFTLMSKFTAASRTDAWAGAACTAARCFSDGATSACRLATAVPAAGEPTASTSTSAATSRSAARHSSVGAIVKRKRQVGLLQQRGGRRGKQGQRVQWRFAGRCCVQSQICECSEEGLRIVGMGGSEKGCPEVPARHGRRILSEVTTAHKPSWGRTSAPARQLGEVASRCLYRACWTTSPLATPLLTRRCSHWPPARQSTHAYTATPPLHTRAATPSLRAPPVSPADPVGTRDPPRARHAMYSTAVLPKIPHSNCCKKVPNRPLRRRGERCGTLLQLLECGNLGRKAVRSKYYLPTLERRLRSSMGLDNRPLWPWSATFWGLERGAFTQWPTKKRPQLVTSG